MSSLRAFLGVLLFFLGLYGITFHGYLDDEDAAAVYAAACSYGDRGSLAVAGATVEQQGAADHMRLLQDPVSGEWFPVHPSLQILMHVPAVMIGRQLSFLAKSLPEDVARMGFACVNVFAGTLCSLLVLLLGRRLGYRPRTAVVTALLGGSCTMLWCYAQSTLVELPLAVCTTAAVWVLLSARLPPDGSFARSFCWLVLAALLHGIAGALNPAALLLLVPTLWFLRTGGLRCVLTYLLPVIAAVVLGQWADAAVFGRPGQIGGLGAALSGHALATSYGLGVHGLLFSDGRGLFVLSPLLLLSLLTFPRFHGEQRRRAQLFAGHLAVLVAFFAAFDSWSDDWSWGVRHLVPAVPLLCVLVGHWLERPGRWRRAFTCAVAAVSLWVQVLSVAVPFRIYMNVTTNSGRDAESFVFHWRHSPVLAQQRVLLHKIDGAPDVYSQRLLFGALGADADGDRGIDITAVPRPDIDRHSAGFQHLAWVRIFAKGHGTAAILGVSSCVLAMMFGLWWALRSTRPHAVVLIDGAEVVVHDLPDGDRQNATTDGLQSSPWLLSEGRDAEAEDGGGRSGRSDQPR